ncbi:MAG: hypothetical protein JSV69_06880 [Chloroflexota bacterium]|nr:MAG: hypothetical protein JSV69_06880 [Chloroflexota bacterium]
MSDQPRKRSPWRLSFFVFLGVTGFYIFLARPAEPVNDLIVKDDLAYLALGRAGLVIVDASDPGSPEEIGSFDTRGSANAVATDGQNGYIADGRDGLRIMDVSNPFFPREIGAYNTPGYAQDLDLVNNRVYIADGGSGLLLVNVRDKQNPFLVSSYSVRGNIRRVAVQGNYAYLGDNQNQFRVVNISKPQQLEEVATLDVGGEIQDIVLSENRAYLAVGTQGMVIVDISNPTIPQVLTIIETAGNVQGVAVNQDIVAYLADGEDGLLVYDITDLNAIERTGSFDDFFNANRVVLDEGALYLADRDSALYVVDAEVTLAAQSVSTTEQQQGNARAVAVNDNLAFLVFADQGLRVIDVSNPSTPSDVANYDSPGASIDVTLSGDFIYLADGAAGMQVLFLESSGSQNPQISVIAGIDTPGEANHAAVVGQTIYLADGSGGLSVISTVNPAQPLILGTEDTPGIAKGVAVLGDFAYVADGEAGLRVINILDGSKPAEVAAIDTPGDAQAVVVRQLPDPNNRIYAYVADGGGGLRVIDVTNPVVPVEVGSFTAYETVQDVIIVGENAHLAAGSLGLRIVRIADPTDIAEVGFYNSPGEARGLAFEDEITYVADNTRGMRIVDVSNPSVPVEIGFYDVPRVVRGVTVAANFAYLSDVENGFRIAEISDPRRLRQVGHYDQGGIVEELKVQGNVAYLADSIGLQTVNIADPRNPTWMGELSTTGRANSVFVVNNLAYVTDSVFGLRIADVSDPAAILSLSNHPTRGSGEDVFVANDYAYIADGEAGLMIINIADPRDPKTASVIDQFQNANSVIVIGDYAYLADETNGVWVIDVSKPVAPETIAFVDTPGIALDLDSSGVYLFVADGEAGVQVIYILNPTDPSLVGGVELDGFSLDLDVEWRPGDGGSPGSFFVYVAKGDRGLEILTVGKGVQAGTIGLYETPGMAPLRQVVEDNFPIISRPGVEKSSRTVRQTAFDVFIVGILGLSIWLAFFAQYLLPLNSLRERRAAIGRLVRYFLWMHGPAIRIENGKVIQSHHEKKLKSPGVILLDTASAAMLRTKTTFVRAVGPGVIFTEGGEFLHQEAVDLHTQIRPLPPLGPLGTEDPYAPWSKKKEEEKEYQARQNRRKETSGLTRDGVEIVPNILAVAKTKSLPGQGGTRFGFNAKSVSLAITREGIVPDGLRNVAWYEIPAYLTVELWREYLSKFTLTELFISPNEESGFQSYSSGGNVQQSPTSGDQTRFELILRMIRMRLTQPEVPLLDDYGRESNGSQASREYQILEEMGIQVIDVSISNPRFPRTVESQLVQQWLSTWLERAIAERDAIENRRTLAGEKGKDAALLEFAEGVAQNLGETLVDDEGNVLPFNSQLRPDLKASLEMLVSSTEQLLIRNTKHQQWVLNEEADLNRLLEWIRRE